MRKAKTYNVSFRCHYNDAREPGHYTQHWQDLPLRDLHKWVEAYRFTHPTCTSVSIKLWLKDDEEVPADD